MKSIKIISLALLVASMQLYGTGKKQMQHDAQAMKMIQKMQQYIQSYQQNPTPHHERKELHQFSQELTQYIQKFGQLHIISGIIYGVDYIISSKSDIYAPIVEYDELLKTLYQALETFETNNVARIGHKVGIHNWSNSIEIELMLTKEKHQTSMKKVQLAQIVRYIQNIPAQGYSASDIAKGITLGAVGIGAAYLGYKYGHDLITSIPGFNNWYNASKPHMSPDNKITPETQMSSNSNNVETKSTENVNQPANTAGQSVYDKEDFAWDAGFGNNEGLDTNLYQTKEDVILSPVQPLADILINGVPAGQPMPKKSYDDEKDDTVARSNPDILDTNYYQTSGDEPALTVGLAVVPLFPGAYGISRTPKITPPSTKVLALPAGNPVTKEQLALKRMADNFGGKELNNVTAQPVSPGVYYRDTNKLNQNAMLADMNKRYNALAKDTDFMEKAAKSV